MAIIKCKMCGGDVELAADKTFGSCEFCGSTMTFPKVDDDQRAAAFNRGNHFRRIGEFDKALAVYERIVREDDTDAEAHWCCALCRFGIEYVEDPATFEWLPTCHRASFDSFLEDVDYLAAVEHSDGVTRRQYQKDGAKIAEVQRGILATSQNTEPYDVFICYKESDENGGRTRDSLMAQDIYYQLTEQGRKVFFARITLEDVVGTQYEPYIFAALNSAKVMIVVGTKPEYLNAVWVKNEWSRFLAMMKKDRHKLLLPCYRDMDPYDLPEQLSVLQSYDMAKIGFIQDLTRGIAKVLDADKKPEFAHQTVVVQQQAGGSNVTALVKRGNMALEDGEWAKADEFFEEVLNQDAECAEAYLGKALAEQRLHNLQELANQRLSASETAQYKKVDVEVREDYVAAAVQKMAIPGYLDAKAVRNQYNYYASYDSYIDSRSRQLYEEEQFWKTNRNLVRAQQFATGEVAVELNNACQQVLNTMQQRLEAAVEAEVDARVEKEEAYEKFLASADEKVARMRRDAETARDNHYEKKVKAFGEANSPAKLEGIAREFDALGDYRESREMAERCRQRAQELRKEEAEARTKREAEEKATREKREAEEKAAKAKREAEEKVASAKREEAMAARKKKITIIACICAVCVILAGIGVYFLGQHMKQMAYEEAEQLLAEGKYTQAIEAFTELGNYKDSADRRNESRYAYADVLLASGEYEQAAKAFTALSQYKDSAVRVQECHYARAETLLSAGKTAEAAMAFSTAKDYEDAQERSFALWNKFAVRDSVSAGNGHTVGLKADGTVVAAGNRASDKCDVSGWKDIVAVSAGDFHTVGLKADGTVVATYLSPYAWYNYGQGKVSGWTDVVAISTRDDHTVGLKADGTVVAVGRNDFGQCDVSAWKDIVAISAGYNHTVGLKADGTVVAVGSNLNYKRNVSDWSDIIAISAGSNHTVGLKADGTVVAVGWNNYGECDVDRWTDIVAISAGDDHTVGLKADGTVVAVGWNNYGECDVDRWTDIVAISAGWHHTVGLKADGTVVAVGNNKYGQCEVSGWKNIKLPDGE